MDISLQRSGQKPIFRQNSFPHLCGYLDILCGNFRENCSFFRGYLSQKSGYLIDFTNLRQFYVRILYFTSFLAYLRAF